MYTKSVVLRMEKLINGAAVAQDAEHLSTNQLVSVQCSLHVEVCLALDKILLPKLLPIDVCVPMNGYRS